MKILWVDDEIELLEPHIMFLEEEGNVVIGVDHPEKALEILKEESFDLILLDYRMPGLDGLETFKEIKRVAPNIPVALVTMVTDKDIIEASIAEEVFDYIVKPVQPSQILALLKKLEVEEIRKKRLGSKIIEIYRELSSIEESYEGWIRKFRLLLDWKSEAMDETLISEWKSQNLEFARWVSKEYPALIKDEELLFSHNIVKKKVLPLLDEEIKVALFIFDNFRGEQFLRFIKTFPGSFKVDQTYYMAILPTATPFARNAIFSGKLPLEIERVHPDWILDNRHEIELLGEQLKEEGYSWVKYHVNKINTLSELQNVKPRGRDLEVYVVNFIDLLSHIRQGVDALKDLTPDGEAFIRWSEFVLEEAGMKDKIARFLKEGYTVFLTSDHGWVEADNPVVVLGGGELTQGLRYKFGDSVRIGGKGALLVRDLPDFGLPIRRGMGRLALATGYSFFVYPSDPHRFEKVYRGGIYHGGISLEEMIIPLVQIRAT